uniref:Uncharacterized protein n=1 Tax=Physcomitrium patens TaxID=3218 RepID=A0A7I3Z313_PHYPA
MFFNTLMKNKTQYYINLYVFLMLFHPTIELVEFDMIQLLHLQDLFFYFFIFLFMSAGWIDIAVVDELLKGPGLVYELLLLT